MEEVVPFRLLVATSLLTILSVAAGPGGYSCPSVCTCYVDELHGFRTANCSGVNFLTEYKYNKLFHEIEVLNLQTESDDDVTTLWDDMFLSFTKLKLLNLSKCRINHLPKNVFKGLKKVYEIDLSYNDIKHFDNVVFENIYTLFKLSLRGNPLQASYKPFISSSSLRDLDLGYCSMTVLQNEFFNGVKRLARLHLDGNHLQTIKDHILPRGITHLNLASNRIVSVPISTIFSLNKLKWIDLGANPVNCTCALLNLQDRLSGRGIIIDGNVRCAYPLELENVSLSKINENELCNKETFSSNYHYRKSQSSKNNHSQKKDQYFENDNYSPLESFQGDDPGQSADEFADYDSVEEGVKDAKTDTNYESDDNQDDNLETDVGVVGKTKDEDTNNLDRGKQENSGASSTKSPQTDGLQPQNLIKNENKDEGETKTPNSESEVEVLNDGNGDVKNLEKQILNPDGVAPGENKIEALAASVNATENNPTVPERKSDAPLAGGVILSDKGDAKQAEEETTQPAMTTDPDFTIPDFEINEKSNLGLVGLDEGLKKEDEILPVVEPRGNEHTESEASDKDNNYNKNTSKDDANIIVAENKDVETTVPKNENEYLSENKNDLEESVIVPKVNSDLNVEPAKQPENEKEDNHLHEKEVGSNLSGDRESNNFGVALDNKPEQTHHISSTVETIVANGEDGSGDGAVDISEEIPSVPIVPNDVTQETLIPSPEIPIVPNPENNPVETVRLDENDDVSNESSRQIVAKDSMSYQAIGPYILVAGIILLITVLVLVSIYKGLCKPKENNRKPVPDVEARNGTELQDMKSLLPQTPVNGEKHNDKYPNEVPSPETVNLIKDNKTDDTLVPNESHDLNQNDNRNESIVKNGKAPEASPPPIEKTKAKLTVLHESIPRTPIFVQKRPAAVN